MGRNETKQEVFDALLKEVESLGEAMIDAGRTAKEDVKEEIDGWRKRYEKAETFQFSHHDVEDLYELYLSKR